jgi:hypothetical protein
LLNQRGFRFINYDNYCITADLAGEGEKSLDILAHLDVVPVLEGLEENAAVRAASGRSLPLWKRNSG